MSLQNLCFIIASLQCLFILSVADFYDPKKVTPLNAINFKNVTEDDSVWLVEIFAPWCGHCQKLVPEYLEACRILKGIVKCGGINNDEKGNKDLTDKYHVKGLPTIKIFGKDKLNPIDYQGSRTAKDIVAFLKKVVNDMIDNEVGGKSGREKKSTHDKKAVIELTDGNFDKLVMNSEDMWLVEIFAPWCGHCKNLAPEWERAASDLKGRVKLGALDGTQHQMAAGKFKVQGYPTILYFPAGPKSEPEEFDGGRKASDIVAWAENKLTDSIPPPELKQIINEAALRGACDNNKLCIIAFLPHILDCQSKCRNDYLTMLKGLAAEFKKSMLGWLWTEAGQQPEIEKALEIGGFGYPAMVAVNSKKKIYTTLRGPFSQSGVKEFLRDINYGKAGISANVKEQNFDMIKDLLPWDGKDGKLDIEEEIDLSDVELDDDNKAKKVEL